MTLFVTRDATNLGAGVILTSPTMYALYDNLFAMTEGAAGAPKIQTAAITDAAVTSGKLATAERSFAGTVDEFDTRSIVYTDEYGFTPRLTGGATMLFEDGGLRIVSGAGVNNPYTVTWRYITA